jgi:zinc transport system permease protein
MSPITIPATAGTPLVLDGVVDPALELLLDLLWGTLLDIVADLTGIRMLGFPFMQRAYLAALCIGLIGPLVGSFLVHREMAMIGDTLAHSAFAGVAAGLFVNSVYAVTVSPLLTALLVAAVAALLVQTLVDYAGAYRDTSLAIVLTGSFAVGSVLITATDGGIAVGINAYLFGSLATVTRISAGILVGMSLAVGLLVTVAYRPLIYVTFDEVGARASGLSVTRYNQLLAVLTAVVVVGAMQIMGVILVAAMLVVPVAAATVVGGFKQSVLAAIAAGQVATVAGVSLSYLYDVAAGGTIVLVAIAIYGAVQGWTRVRHRSTFRRTTQAATDEEETTPAADGGSGER